MLPCVACTKQGKTLETCQNLLQSHNSSMKTASIHQPRVNLEGLEGKALEDAVMAESDAKNKKLRSQKSLLKRLMMTKSSKRLLDEDEAKRTAAAAAAAGSKGAGGAGAGATPGSHQQGQGLGRHSDLPLDPHSNEDIRNDLLNDTLMRAEAKVGLCTLNQVDP